MPRPQWQMNRRRYHESAQTNFCLGRIGGGRQKISKSKRWWATRDLQEWSFLWGLRMSPVIGKGARDAQGLGLLVIRGCGMIAVTKFCVYTSCAAAQSSKSDPHEILENSVRVDTTELFRLHNFLKPAAVACHVWIILVRGWMGRTCSV